MKKLVSVIMSTYNENTCELKAAIDSILNQTYKYIEFLIIIDNPSNNEIKSIINKLSKKDNRIKIITNEKNLGLARSLNKGISVAQGYYIARMDADDIAYENRIEKQVKFIEDNKLDMVASNRVDIDTQGNILGNKSSLPLTQDINRILPVGNFITHPTVLLKREMVKELGGYRNFVSAQDYDLWLRVLSNGYKIGIIDEALLFYRIRENSISNSNKYRQYLIGKYQKMLYWQRVKNKKDEFSEINLEKFLDNHNCYDEQTNTKFNEGYKLFNEAVKYIKSKNYIKGTIYILKSMLKNKENIIYIRNTIMYKLLMNKKFRGGSV